MLSLLLPSQPAKIMMTKMNDIGRRNVESHAQGQMEYLSLIIMAFHSVLDAPIESLGIRLTHIGHAPDDLLTLSYANDFNAKLINPFLY